MKLDLPKSSTAEPAGVAGQPQEAELVLRADGTVLLGREPILPSDLPGRLQQIRGSQPDGRIMVKAEAGARHGEVVHLLDLVREAGFAGVGIGTEVPMGGVQR
jgi:biopolymer transport protein ExbD